MSTLSEAYFGNYADLFGIFGAVVAAYIAASFLSSIGHGIQTYFLSKPLGFPKDLKKLGEWAVITGATDGIGKAYAEELAKKGLKIALVSRSPEKLYDVAQEITKKYCVETKTVTADFTDVPGVFDRIKKEISDLNIAVLVNNVGISSSYPDYFGNESEKGVMNLINVNIHSVTMMTHMVLPGMLLKKKGAIINVASGSALTPTPLLASYSASKVFVDHFSLAIRREYASKGILVQSVLPFFVATKMSRMKPSIISPAPGYYVRNALNTVGLEDRTFGCVPHAIQAYIVERLPLWLRQTLSWKTLYPVKLRAEKRQQREQKAN